MRLLKFSKKGVISFLVAALVMVFASGAWAADISTFEELKGAFAAGGVYKLTDNINITEEITTSENIVLDLNGYCISSDKKIHVGDTIANQRGSRGTLTLNNSAPTVGKIKFNGAEKHGNCFQINGDWTTPVESRIDVASTLTVNENVKISSSGWYCVRVLGMGATLNIDGAELRSNPDIASAAIAGRGNAYDNGTTINITGGVIAGGSINGTAAEGSGLAIYHPQSGDLVISGGTLTGYDGIQFKSGKLNMTGGTITATGAHVDPIEFGNGSVATGTAVSFISNEGYTGDMYVDISGTAVLNSTHSNALHIGPVGSADQRVVSVNLSGGSFTGEASKKGLNFVDVSGVTIDVTGGTYSSDPTEYVNPPYVVKQAEGKYTVSLAGVTVTPAAAELVIGLTSSAKLEASSDIQEETFTWSTSNGEVVTVDGDGTIWAAGEGKAFVTATGSVSRKSASCEVTVRAADDVVVTPAKLELAVGGSAKVTAKYDQADVISWETNDAGIATVSTDGTVKALKAGIAVITAKGKAYSAGCVVTVTDPDVPAPTPTPQPVSPATVDKEGNPVNNDSGKPENVEAAASTLFGTDDCTKEDVASTTGFKEEDLVANAEGDLTVNPVIAKKAIEGVMSADSTVTPKNITLLPIVKATVDTEKNVAAIALILWGAELGAQDGTVAGDINLIKVFADGTGAKFGYAAAASEYGDKMFALKDVAGKNLTATDKVAADKQYKVIAFVADNGDFDLDATPKNVIDPIAVATNAAAPAPSGGGSGGGCNGGFGLLALLGLALVPALYGKKK